MQFNSIPELIEDIRQGKMIVLVDDESRENEGDLVMASALIRPEDINFMARYARGLICITLTPERCAQLKLPLMVPGNENAQGTNFTLSIDAAAGVTTGISAADRAKTIQAAVNKDAKPTDLVQPGHIFPLMARPGGVLNRAGHTEAGCDLVRLVGLEPSAVIVEIMNENGTMARRSDLEQFAAQHQLQVGTIADLIRYRTLHEKTVNFLWQKSLETIYGPFQVKAYSSIESDHIHVALIKGDLSQESAPYVRVHVIDVVRDLLSATRSGRVGWSLQASLKYMASVKAGVVLLLGESVSEDFWQQRLSQFFTNSPPSKPKSAEDSGSQVYRTIGTGSQILRELGIQKMRLLSSKLKFNALSGFDLEIVEYIEPVE